MVYSDSRFAVGLWGAGHWSVIPLGKGRIYHQANWVLYGEGYTPDEFRDLVARQSSGAAWLQLLSPAAHAACVPSDILRPLHRPMQEGSVGLIESCHYDLQKMITEQIQTILRDTTAIVDGSFFSKLSESFAAIREVLPDIFGKLIVPVQELMQELPQTGHAMSCAILRDKLESVGFALVTGGGGLPMALARVAKGTAEAIEKVRMLTRNRTIVNYARALEKNGKMTEKNAAALLRIETDLSADLKRSVSGFENRDRLVGHSEKHGQEFLLNTKASDAYEVAARRFAKATDKDNVAFQDAFGDVMKWNTRTEEVIVVTKTGKIRTYYRNTCKPPEHQLLRLVAETVEGRTSLCQ